MNQLSPAELKKKLATDRNTLLIDVREEYEFEDLNIGGQNVPLANVMEAMEDIDQDKKLVFCCKSGRRSQAIAQMVERKTLRENIYYLEGGIEAYFEEFN